MKKLRQLASQAVARWRLLFRRPVNIWLDDARPEPFGWVRCYWPHEVIKLILNPKVTIGLVSLDHDLGDDERGTGYDVLAWVEEEVFLDRLHPPAFKVHSANPVARDRMNKASRSIDSLVARNQSNKSYV